jgi:prepilin-type N-terminal cleavage/methylation domain-containing protein
MMTQEKTHVNYVKEWTCLALTMATRKQGIPLRNSRGFTLVELIVVCAILGVLIGFAIPSYTKYKDLAKVSAAMSEIRTIELAINSYVAENGSKPADLNQVKYDTLTDPWANHFEYRQTAGTLEYVTGDFVLGGVGNTDYDLWCKGKDGSSGTALSVNENLIVRARSGGFVGLASNY